MSGSVLPDWLQRRAEDHPNKLAFISHGARFTFRELDDEARVVAASLHERGITRGDRVALVLRNGPEFATLVHGIGRLGATIVPINVRLTPSEVAWQLADCGVKLIVTDPHPDLRSLVEGTSVPIALPSDVGRAGARSRPRNHVVSLPTWLALEAPPSPPVPVEPIDLDAIHSIIYTSGTTGRPKGAMLTRGNVWWSAIGSALNLGLRDDDRWLAVLPLFHVGGLSILTRGVIYGMTVHVHESFVPGAANAAIDDGVTIVSVVAAMLQRMLDQRGDRPYPPHFRCMLLGGGPAPEPLLRDCERRGVPVVQTYGLTETTSQLATLSPADALRKLGSAGRPLLPNQLRIELPDGSVAPTGSHGEIVVSGPSVTAGYVNRPEATAETIRDGWLHTGDLGYLDDEGFLYVLDRRDDLIVSGGENVYPAEIEAALLAHPAVQEVGVVGQPDERWGQVPVAVLNLKPGSAATEVDLLAHATTLLARYKLPRRIVIQTTSLPRTASGKLVRSQLRAALAAMEPPAN